MAENEFNKLANDIKFEISQERGYKVYYYNYTIDPSKESPANLNNHYVGSYFFKNQRLKSFSFGFY